MQLKVQLKQDFYALCEIEPRLKLLEAAIISYVAESYRPNAKYDPDEKWYGFGKYRGEGINPEMVRLVGFSAENPTLTSSADYDTAYNYLYLLISDPNTKKIKSE
jgi:hypothetical protein